MYTIWNATFAKMKCSNPMDGLSDKIYIYTKFILYVKIVCKSFFCFRQKKYTF